MSTGTTILKAPCNLDFEAMEYWRERVSKLTNDDVLVLHRLPITFYRENWTGELGVIYPLGPNTFSIEYIDGIWTMTTRENIVTMTNKEGKQYHGFKTIEGEYCFSECGCEREDEDPRIAFAQVMYTI